MRVLALSFSLCLFAAAPALGQGDPPPNPLGKEKPANPLGKKKPVNPLARRAPSPWVGEFASDDGKVVLTLKEEETLSGTLNVGGQEFPLTLTRSSETDLAGTFSAGGQAFEFVAKLKGDDVTLESGGATHDLKRKGPPPNPLAGGGTPASPAPAQGDSPIAGAYTGPVTQRQGPQGLFTYDLPQGWTEGGQQPGVVGFNVPVNASGIKEAAVLLFYGDLEPNEMGMSAKKALETSGVQDVHTLLSQQMGIQKTSTPTVTGARVNGDDAAYAQWKGIQQGTQRVSIWASTVIREHIAISQVAIVLEGTEEAHLSRVKRIFSSIRILKVPPRGSLQGGGGGGGGQ